MGIETKVNSKINGQINNYMFNWIMHYPQAVQSPIVNDCIKVNIDGHNRPQIVPNVLLQVSTQELRNTLVSDPVDSGR